MMVRTVIVVLLMFLVSCNNETNESSVVHFVERSDVKMSELVSEYTVIPLETRDDNLILDASMLIFFFKGYLCFQLEWQLRR